MRAIRRRRTPHAHEWNIFWSATRHLSICSPARGESAHPGSGMQSRWPARDNGKPWVRPRAWLVRCRPRSTHPSRAALGSPGPWHLYPKIAHCRFTECLKYLPAGIFETGATPQGDGPVSAHQPAPHCRSGRQKGGVAPVHLRFPRAAPPSRKASRNPNGDSRLEKSRRAHRKASFMHMPPVVSCALPERHEMPSFSVRNQPHFLAVPERFLEFDTGAFQHLAQLQIPLVVLQRAGIRAGDSDGHPLGRFVRIRH